MTGIVFRNLDAHNTQHARMLLRSARFKVVSDRSGHVRKVTMIGLHCEPGGLCTCIYHSSRLCTKGRHVHNCHFSNIISGLSAAVDCSEPLYTANYACSLQTAFFILTHTAKLIQPIKRSQSIGLGLCRCGGLHCCICNSGCG